MADIIQNIGNNQPNPQQGQQGGTAPSQATPLFTPGQQQSGGSAAPTVNTGSGGPVTGAGSTGPAAPQAGPSAGPATGSADLWRFPAQSAWPRVAYKGSPTGHILPARHSPVCRSRPPCLHHG